MDSLRTSLVRLADQFRACDTRTLARYIDRISSKDAAGEIFPSYIPLVGTKYGTYRVLVYGTAQMIRKKDDIVSLYAAHRDKLTQRLEWSRDFRKHYPESLDYSEVEIAPWKAGVLPALAGIFLYCQHGRMFKSFAEIQDHVAVSNYYKFSMNDGKDINPNLLNDGGEYWRLNDDLVYQELEVLKPSRIIAFNGRHVEKLRKHAKVVLINDPAWILRGASGMLRDRGKWAAVAARVSDQTVLALVDEHYIPIIRSGDGYAGKAHAVRNYLLKYYADWRSEIHA